jgi:hypothetical protein
MLPAAHHAQQQEPQQTRPLNLDDAVHQYDHVHVF